MPEFLMRFIKGAGFIFVKRLKQHGVIYLTVTTPVRSHIAPVSLGCQPVMVPFQPPCFLFIFFHWNASLPLRIRVWVYTDGDEMEQRTNGSLKLELYANNISSTIFSMSLFLLLFIVCSLLLSA